jgi:hypothetical protein
MAVMAVMVRQIVFIDPFADGKLGDLSLSRVPQHWSAPRKGGFGSWGWAMLAFAVVFRFHYAIAAGVFACSH